MELTETIESLNQQLIDEYGLDSSTGQAMFRIVWSDDQREKRYVNEVGGIHLLHPEVREMRKYPYIKAKYVLERLVIVPEEQKRELVDIKLSYEPIWTYRTAKDEYLPPTWQASKFIIDLLYAALGKKGLAKYIQEDDAETRVNKLREELFGNETEVTDALAYKEGIVVPHNFKES